MSSVKGLENLFSGKRLPLTAKALAPLLSRWSSWNNYIVGGGSGEVTSFLVWDNPGSPMEMQAACISHCSTSRRLPLPSSYCISPEMGTQAAQARHCWGEIHWWTSQCSAWMSAGRGSSRALLGPCRDWPGSSHSPQAAAPAESPLAVLSPTVLPAAPPSLSTLPAPGLGTHERWEISIPINLSCLHLPQSSFIPEQIASLSAHSVHQPFFYPYRLAPSATRQPGDAASTPG